MPRISFPCFLAVLCVFAQSAGARAQDAGVPDAGGAIPVEAAEEEEQASPEEPPEAPPTGEAEETPQSEYEQGFDEPTADQVSVPRTVCEGRLIRGVRLTGLTRVSEDDVSGTLRLRSGVPCQDTDVTRDARALWDLGYFDDIRVDATREGNGVTLVFELHERPAIGHIRYEGNGSVSASDLDEKVTLREGAVLSVPDVREQIDKIRDLYAEKGFFLATVTYALRDTDTAGEVDVVFQIVEGSAVTVRRIRFTGNQHVPDSDLTGVMQTGETGFFSFISNNNRFRRDHFEEDTNRLQAIYYDRGYLTVQVGTPRVELTADRRHIDITIPVAEGPRFHIGRVAITETNEDGEEVDPLGGRRALRSQIEVEPGDWFSRTAIARNLLAITRYYKDRGYAQVQITPETQIENDRSVVHINVRIQRGPLVRIERIQIRGNTKTRDTVIRREITLIEGELYSQTRVEASKARITALGYFERVDVSEEEGSAPDRLVVTYEVVERATGTFQVGAGFSSIESFIFTAQVQQQNLFGLGYSLSLQLQLSGIRQLVQIRFVEPYLFNTEWSLAVDAFKTVRQFGNFNRDSTGGSLTVGHPFLDPNLRFFLQYTAEYVDITDRLSGNTIGGVNQGAFVQLQSPFANLFRNGLTSSVRLSVAYDDRDNRLYPTRGVYASYSIEVADEAIGSQSTFSRQRAFFRWYYPIIPGVVLKMNTEWGLVTSRQPQGVPIYERFFLGGIMNVRGFRLNSLGPNTGLVSLDPNATPSFAGGTPFGGNMQLFYNLELEFSIVESVGVRGVLFTDAGNAWNLEANLCNAAPAAANDIAASPCGLDLTRTRFSVGFGVRWFSPLGPLRFEWGIPINPRSYEQNVDFQFTIGNFF